MQFCHRNGLKYLRFGLLDEANVNHGVFTKHGGVSPSPWASLNIGGTVGDSRLNVIENRRRIFEALGRPVESIYDSAQVHGGDVLFADNPRPLSTPQSPGDVLITDSPSVTLLLRFADCVPLLLFDPVRHVISLIHSGWKGTLLKAAAIAIRAMQQKYCCSPSNILAGIGPSICAKHFEIGPEVASLVTERFAGEASHLLCQEGPRVFFDLWGANRLILEQAGVKHIEQARICTCCHNGDWYSYRATDKVTGHFGALIALQAK